MTNSTPNQPRKHVSPTTATPHPWLVQVSHWFQTNPGREFWLTEMPISAIQSVGLAGWIVGSATCSPNDPPGVDVLAWQTTVPCIVRRADAAKGRALHSVFFLDGGFLPPVPRSGDPAQTEEGIAKMMWGFAQMAESVGVSLRKLPFSPYISARRKA